MENTILNKFRDSLRTHRNTLTNWFNSAPDYKKSQCCADSASQLAGLIHKHDETIEQIDSGEFGRCSICNGEVEIERLELDFTSSVCLEHYTDNELKNLERDLELAAKVQKQLLPSRLPAMVGIEIAAHTEPAKIVSGDYFDFFSYANGAQGIAVADVMGKGLPASMLMSNLQASLRILGPEYNDLGKLTYRLNELFRYNLKLISFITFFVLRIDTVEKTITFCNAGHNPALFWDSSGKTLKTLRPTGPAIGIVSEPVYSSDRINYNKGDVMVLYTDGITEARNTKGEEYGEGRLQNFMIGNIAKPAEVFISELRRQTKSFSGILQDDATLVVIKF
jgi:sigma-B regulation protein RsbU (phosphoserine phosphatase)